MDETLPRLTLADGMIFHVFGKLEYTKEPPSNYAFTVLHDGKVKLLCLMDTVARRLLDKLETYKDVPEGTDRFREANAPLLIRPRTVRFRMVPWQTNRDGEYVGREPVFEVTSAALEIERIIKEQERGPRTP